MVPLWFLPFAIVTGQHLRAEAVGAGAALAAADVRALLQQCDLPPGVVNLVNGGSEVVNAFCDHPGIRAVSFVGSTPVAQARLPARRRTRASACRRSAARRTSSIVMPDADLDQIDRRVTESFYGCAGQRCLAGSVLVPVGDAHERARDASSPRRRAVRVGDGSQPGVTMGPVISARHRDRVPGTSRRASPRAPAAPRRPRDARRRIGRRILRRPDVFDDVVARHGHRPRGDLRPGRVDHAGAKTLDEAIA